MSAATRCPACGRKVRAIPIVYGYPAPETLEAADRGEVAIGGCVVIGDDPTHRCRECHADLVRADAGFELSDTATARNFDELLWELDAADGELDGEIG